MVRVAVRDDHALDRPPLKLLRKHLLPCGACCVIGNAAIDDGPAIAIGQQPQVDMVQRKWQTHAQPAHAGRDFQGMATVRQRIGQRINEFGFQRIHAIKTFPGAAGAGRAAGFPNPRVPPTIAGN